MSRKAGAHYLVKMFVPCDFIASTPPDSASSPEQKLRWEGDVCVCGGVVGGLGGGGEVMSPLEVIWDDKDLGDSLKTSQIVHSVKYTDFQ